MVVRPFAFITQEEVVSEVKGENFVGILCYQEVDEIRKMAVAQALRIPQSHLLKHVPADQRRTEYLYRIEVDKHLQKRLLFKAQK